VLTSKQKRASDVHQKKVNKLARFFVLAIARILRVARLSFMSDKNKTFVLPDDLPASHALIDELRETVVEQNAEIKQLKLELAEVIRRAFEKRPERYIEDPNQLKLDLGGSDDAADAAEGLSQAVEEAEQTIAEHTRRKKARKPRQDKLPDHLERYEVEAKIPEGMDECEQHGKRKIIGYEYTETLEYERPKLRVRVTKYPKFVCEGSPDCGLASPERPASLVEGDRYDPSIAAEIITAKYSYHMPIYRQQDTFGSNGWTPSRSTLVNIATAAAEVIGPLIEHFTQVVLASPIIGTDDTRLTLLLPPTIPEVDVGNPKSKRIHEVFVKARKENKRSVSARMWAYRSVTVPLNVFDFTVSRHRDGPDLMLADFSGKLMADCYSGYEYIALRTDGDIQRGACATHARRKVFNARETYPLESSFLLAKFRQLYDIEDRAKVMSDDARFELREQEAKPIWDSMGEWLASDAARTILPKTDFGQALGYLRNHWDPLQLYLTDSRMPIDNNEVEQLMKQVALGRKNWLFIGSVSSGERTANFLTLVSSAVRNDLDVWQYLKDTLDRLLSGDNDYHAMRPDIWRQSHPEAVREYRVDERRDQADRRRVRRAQRRLADRPTSS